MNTPGGLTLITDLGESLRAFDAFKTAFAIGAHPFPNHYVGWQGGSVTVDVYWHTSIGIWGVFERRPPDEGKGAARFWNCFGIADPGKDSMLSITVEINPPHQGENRRTAGVFSVTRRAAFTSVIREGLVAVDPVSVNGRSETSAATSHGKGSRRQEASERS